MNGAAGTVAAFMIPYLLACITMGIAVSTLFRYREQSIMLLLWTSIPILMLSGASFPREAIPSGSTRWDRCSQQPRRECFHPHPQHGASFAEVLPEIRTLWIMTIVYGAMACFGIHRILRREPCERGVRSAARGPRKGPVPLGRVAARGFFRSTDGM